MRKFLAALAFAFGALARRRARLCRTSARLYRRCSRASLSAAMIRWRTSPMAARCAATSNSAPRIKATSIASRQPSTWRRSAPIPARYVPQYGGYCAWAVAKGYTASGNPNYWRIVDGKLYLNYNAEIQAALGARHSRPHPQRQRNWPSVLSR